MFSPLGALGATNRGYLDFKEKDEPQLMNQLGIQALGRALMPPSGNAEQGPQPPPPGQASMPSQPQQSPMPAQAPTPPGAGGQPPMQPVAQQAPQPGPAQPIAMPPQQMGSQPGNGLDLRSLMARIAQANPGIPPQAMVAALTHAAPILNADAQRQLLDIRRSIYGLGADMRTRQMDLRQRQLDLREQGMNKGKGAGGARAEMPPEAVQALQEGHVTTFGNGQQWTLQNGQPMQVGGPQDGTLRGQPDEPMDQTNAPAQKYSYRRNSWVPEFKINPEAWDHFINNAPETGQIEDRRGEPPVWDGMDMDTPRASFTRRSRPGTWPDVDRRMNAGRTVPQGQPDEPMDDNTMPPNAQLRQGGPVPGVNDSGNYNPTQRSQPQDERRPYRGPEIPMEEFQRRQIERLRQQYPGNVPWREIDRLNMGPEGGNLPTPSSGSENAQPIQWKGPANYGAPTWKGGQQQAPDRSLPQEYRPTEKRGYRGPEIDPEKLPTGPRDPYEAENHKRAEQEYVSRLPPHIQENYRRFLEEHNGEGPQTDSDFDDVFGRGAAERTMGGEPPYSNLMKKGDVGRQRQTVHPKRDRFDYLNQ